MKPGKLRLLKHPGKVSIPYVCDCGEKTRIMHRSRSFTARRCVPCFKCGKKMRRAR